MIQHRYPGPIGRLSYCAANTNHSSVMTITFLGEQDITGPDMAVLFVDQTTERPSCVRWQPDRRQAIHHCVMSAWVMRPIRTFCR